MKDRKGLLFVCFNARSVYPKCTNAAKLISGFDIAGVVESWLTPTISDSMMHVPGYQFIRLDRYPNRNKKAGGLMLYFKDDVIATIDNNSSIIDREYEILCVDLEFGKIKYKVYVCYRPPDKDVDKNAIYKKLTALKSTVTKKQKNYIYG